MNHKWGIIFVLIFSVVRAEAFLWNGERAEEGQFPATVSLMKHDYHLCTAAKVGEFLYITAAHCVDGMTLEEELTLHSGVSLYKEKNLKQKRFKVFIQKIWIHPDYKDEEGPDVAFLQLKATAKNKTPFAIAKIDNRTLKVGDEVMMAGYGKVSEMEFDSSKNLNFALNKVERITNYEYILKGTNYLTPMPGEPAALDHGDSGGALYLASDSSNLTIVGVNSSRFFWLDSHITRLDRKASNKISDWIFKILKTINDQK